MRFSILLVFLIPCLGLHAQIFPELGAQRAGISALTFLNLDLSPRSAALAGANICLSSDAFGAALNPATLSDLKGISVAASHTFWAADIDYSFLSVAKPTSAGVFAISLSGLNSGPMPVRTTFQPEGTGENFYAYYLTTGLSYANRLTDQFSWGTNVRYVREQLAEFRANTVVVDLGFLYNTDFKDLTFAVAIKNFGGNSTLKGSVELDTAFSNKPLNLESYPAPTVFQLGLSMVPWKNADESQTLTAMLQLNHPNDNSENIRLGLEYAYKNLLFLRAGYKVNVKDQPFPTAGVGVRMRLGAFPFRFDYAFDQLQYLGTIHRVGLNIDFSSETR
ncbi:MAG: PorV/PorQ family protein [Bacteroidia bacterium]|nr:PorV/PorQ family protein [Bacteroidia bacterium]